MGVFNKDKKKEFAFVNNAQIKTSNSVNEFISSGEADKVQIQKKNKGGRPKKQGEKLVPINMYVLPCEKEQIENEASKLHMSLSSYLKFKVFS